MKRHLQNRDMTLISFEAPFGCSSSALLRLAVAGRYSERREEKRGDIVCLKPYMLSALMVIAKDTISCPI